MPPPEAPIPANWRVLIVNLVATLIYLVVASTCWIEPEVKDIPGASGGGPIIWGLFAFPILVVFAVLNAWWLVKSVVVSIKARDWKPGVPYILGPIVWSLAVWMDFAHH
ncbi:MAG: hypothetical protein ACFUZC_05310 [Chthoniobacteraceae bacterium]